jgi:hypothetical protein
MEKIEEESADDEELDEATEDALEEIAPLFQAAAPREQELLERMADWAEQAQVQADSKALRLLEDTEGQGFTLLLFFVGIRAKD